MCVVPRLSGGRASRVTASPFRARTALRPPPVGWSSQLVPLWGADDRAAGSFPAALLYQVTDSDATPRVGSHRLETRFTWARLSLELQTNPSGKHLAPA